MEGYGGPAQPSPTIGQCISGGLSRLEVECNRCKTRASLPLDTIRRPRDTPIWKLEAALKCRSCRKGRYAPPVHMIKLTERQESRLTSGCIRTRRGEGAGSRRRAISCGAFGGIAWVLYRDEKLCHKGCSPLANVSFMFGVGFVRCPEPSGLQRARDRFFRNPQIAPELIAIFMEKMKPLCCVRVAWTARD
jgi:hypothetical protein